MGASAGEAGGTADDLGAATTGGGTTGSTGSGVLHAASRAKENATPLAAMIRASLHHDTMGLLILEALGALALLVFIVWWTMFSGRRRGERAADTQPPNDVPNDGAD